MAHSNIGYHSTSGSTAQEIEYIDWWERPEIKEAMELFDMSKEEYIECLPKVAVITAGDKANGL